jgi:DNA repair protein RecO (recombination protein O)
LASYRDEGIVLRTIRLGEADRIVTMATPGHGKVRAVAKGVRKTKSRLGGRVEPLSHVKMLCWRGRELDTITQVDVLDHFRPVREDLDRLAQAMTMLEVVDHVAVEDHEMPVLFTMLLGALRTLATSSSHLVAGAFLWKLLAVEGVVPSLEACARCGRQEPLVAFDAASDGFLCSSCRRGQGVNEQVVLMIRRILEGGLASVLAEPRSAVTSDVERLAIAAVEYHLDRRLRVPRSTAELHGFSL